MLLTVPSSSAISQHQRWSLTNSHVYIKVGSPNSSFLCVRVWTKKYSKLHSNIVIHQIFLYIIFPIFLQSNQQVKCSECSSPTNQFKSYYENPSLYPTNTILELLKGFPNIPGLFSPDLQPTNNQTVSNSTTSQNKTEEYNNSVFNNVHFDYEILDTN